MSRFMILAAPRTGSNLLCSLLDSHPEILCHHELFNPNGVFAALLCRHDEFLSRIGNLQQRDRDPLGFLDRVWRADLGHDCVGFKWTRGQNEFVMRRTLENPLVKKIVLRRCNRIKTCVSEKIAQQTQQWEVYDEGQLVSPMRIAITESELREHIGVNDAFYGDLLSSLQELRQPWIDVTYESLFHRESQRRLLDFLSVRNVDFELRASSVKQNSTDLRDTIINFSELAASLAASDLEADLYDCES